MTRKTSLDAAKRFLLRSSITALGLAAFAPAAGATSVPYIVDDPTYAMPGGLTLQAALAESAYYDSNPLLITAGARPLWGSITSPEIVFGDKTPLTNFNSDTIVSSNNFNQSSFDSNDVHSKMNLNEQTERWGAGVQGNVDYDTTRTSELSNFNFVTAPVRHLGESITPQVSYNFLPTDKLGLAGNYSESQYANSVFTDYNVMSVTPTYTHNFDPENAGLVTLQAQRYRSLNGPENVTDTVGPSIGWQRLFTEQLTGTATIGFQETRQRTESPVNQSWTPQYDFSGNLSYKGDQDITTASASRSEYPFGNGTEALLTQVSINEIHALNERFSIGGGASYQSASYQTNASGDLKSLATATANLTYHATDHVDLVSSYQYRYESLVGTSSSPQENMVLLSVVLRPGAWSL